MNRHCRIGKVKDKKTGNELVILPTNNFKKNSTTQILEEALRFAKTGKFVAVGLFAVSNDGDVYTNYCDSVRPNYIYSLAGVAELQFRIQKDNEQ